MKMVKKHLDIVGYNKMNNHKYVMYEKHNVGCLLVSS